MGTHYQSVSIYALHINYICFLIKSLTIKNIPYISQIARHLQFLPYYLVNLNMFISLNNQVAKVMLKWQKSVETTHPPF